MRWNALKEATKKKQLQQQQEQQLLFPRGQFAPASSLPPLFSSSSPTPCSPAVVVGGADSSSSGQGPLQPQLSSPLFLSRLRKFIFCYLTDLFSPSIALSHSRAARITVPSIPEEEEEDRMDSDQKSVREADRTVNSLFPRTEVEEEILFLSWTWYQLKKNPHLRRGGYWDKCQFNDEKNEND